MKNDSAQPGLGLPRAARLPLLAALHTDLDQAVLLVTDRADHSLSLFDELGFWAGDAPRFHFAEPNPLFYEQAAWGIATRRERLQTLTGLARYHLPFAEKPKKPPVIVTSVRSLMTRSLPRRDFLKACKRLSVGQTIQPELLLRSWVGIGYQRVDTVLEPGQFSHRGGLLDVWPPSEPHPARLDFFGDEIDAIRRFDPASQRTVEKLDALLITPAREFLHPDLSDLSDRLDQLDQLSEFHIPLLHKAPATLLDYLPQKALVLIDDVSVVASVANEVEEQALKFRQESVAEGTLDDDYPIPYLTWSELEDNIHARAWLELGHSTSVSGDQLSVVSDLASCFSHDERFGGRLKPLMDYLGGLVDKGERIVVVSRQSPRLQELWQESREQGLESRLTFIEASLSEGFTLTDDYSLLSTHLITDSEIFGWERPQPRLRQRQAAEAPESLYADLLDGDYVVHIDHGIGRFNGLVQRQLEGHEHEFLAVEYQGGGMLYVPVHQADRLTRYVGPDGGLPSMDSLGGQGWHESKSRVKEAVQKVAEELLDLYARRHVIQGYTFSGDTAWQKELEDSFPYVETEDQAKAITDIKQDMERARPMDRLLCGDVGYGKTEVAVRAAFKAVMDGKQVAMLVPTTVLAQQHYETFCQRLAAFPVKVEMLSRFRTPREQIEILLGLALGEVDIVIGTHRLISSDVQFKDLGLVIIDEEQRFGVTHKEHLKRLRTEVDVLTLTATPIPRTLYMALTGVRDISNLNTPPEERLPIITHVGPYSTKLVRQAILRELERGGQVFFVHNRVYTIDAMRAHLENLVPEARIGVGHGQMPEQQLASVMRQFTTGEIDILLSTSIIESGLDIPNANTLIVDRADTFGLAQLYQLRGRVGRGAMRAYAYFFRHRKLPPTIEGQQRLEVIAENTQLGAGYSIAMRDLEIRGAGDLLGTRQHGYIAAVGFHLYTRLLADSVRRIRAVAGAHLPASAVSFDALNLPLAMPVNVDLPIEVGIPADYIPDQDLRLRLYRRIADLRDESEIDALAAEFKDRFGDLPEIVQNLLYQMRVKLRAEEIGLASISSENGQILLRYPLTPEGDSAPRLRDLGPAVRGGKNAYWLTFGREPDWPERLLDVLEQIRTQ
ncbi:MAG: transcription-repair coupling factor [Anaerolineales bacterium]|nr:transcription-repair coupling factor [Anaerolineales bacterium]